MPESAMCRKSPLMRRSTGVEDLSSQAMPSAARACPGVNIIARRTRWKGLGPTTKSLPASSRAGPNVIDQPPTVSGRERSVSQDRTVPVRLRVRRTKLLDEAVARPMVDTRPILAKVLWLSLSFLSSAAGVYQADRFSEARTAVERGCRPIGGRSNPLATGASGSARTAFGATTVSPYV